jgi:hypothetical protein
MKLTNQQIEYVENYIISKILNGTVASRTHRSYGNKYGGILGKNPDLTFHQVKDNTFKKFTKPELKAIEKNAKILKVKN